MQLVFRKLEFREMQRPKVEIYKAFLFEFPIIKDEISNASWTTIDSIVKNSQQKKNFHWNFLQPNYPLKSQSPIIIGAFGILGLWRNLKDRSDIFFFSKMESDNAPVTNSCHHTKKIKQVILLTKGIQISQQNNSHEKVLQPKPIKHWP